MLLTVLMTSKSNTLECLIRQEMLNFVDWKTWRDTAITWLCALLTTPVSARCLPSVWQHTTQHVARISRWRSLVEVAVSANTSPAAKANISICNTAAWPTHARISVFAWQTGLWLRCSESICIWWPLGHAVENPCFTFLHQSLLGCSPTTVSVVCETREERTEPELWEKQGLKAHGSISILNPVMFLDRDWT